MGNKLKEKPAYGVQNYGHQNSFICIKLNKKAVRLV